MAKIIDYRVVQSMELGTLQGKVLECMLTGWQPLGGIAIRSKGMTEMLYQTLVVYEAEIL